MPPIPDATTMVDDSDKTNDSRVTFSTEVDVEEAAPVESYTRKTSQELRTAKERQSLSASSKAWDIDGDGILDDTELALKALDKSAKGTLNKDQMYQLMNQNLSVQKELGKVKKVVIGLVVFTCLLALANVGTSFAAAFLAKDTSSSEGKLVDSKTGDALATQTTTTIFETSPDLTRRRRKLCTTITGNNGKITSTACTASGQSLTPTNGQALFDACKGGATTTLLYSFTDGDVSHPVCLPGDTVAYSGKGNDAHRGFTITRDGATMDVQPVDADGNIDHATPIEYTTTGFISPAGAYCDVDSDCNDPNFTCQQEYTQTPSSKCACRSDDACGAGEVCSVSECMITDVLPVCIAKTTLDATCGWMGHNTCDVANPTTTSCSTIAEETATVLAAGEACDTANDQCGTGLQCYGTQDVASTAGTCGCTDNSSCTGDHVCTIECDSTQTTPQCQATSTAAGACSSGECNFYDPLTAQCAL